jgi:hypothetical protein
MSNYCELGGMYCDNCRSLYRSSVRYCKEIKQGKKRKISDLVKCPIDKEILMQKVES